MVKSGGDVAVRPPHGGDTGMSPQGQTLFYLTDLTLCFAKIQVDHVLLLFMYYFLFVPL